MWQVTMRGIRAHLGRFFLTALSVMLGIAFLSGTLAFRDVLGQTFQELTTSTATGDLTVRGEPVDADLAYEGGNMPISASLADEINEVPGVEGAYPNYIGTAMIFDHDNQPVNLAQAPALAFNWVAATDEERLSEGRGPENSNEVVLEAGAAEDSGLKVGDTTVLLIGGEPMDVEIVGLLSFGSPMAGASVTMLYPDLAEQYFGADGMVSNIVVVTDGDPETVRDDILEVLPDNYEVLTAEEMQQETEEAVASVLNMINTFLLIFVALALGISIFIITNTFRISVKQRQKEFALLRAVGASPRQVFTVVFVQAIVIGLVGSAVGVVAGQCLVLAIRAMLESYGMPLDAELIMTPSIIATSMVVGVIVTIIAALLPARAAALIPPIEAMRETSGATEKSLQFRTILGTVMFALGIVSFTVGALRVSDRAGWFLGIGAALIIISLIVLIPGLIKPAVAVLGWPLRKLFPVVGKIAAESTVASPRKTASTASALMIGVALVATGATLATSLKASLSDIIESSVTSDLVVTTNTAIADPSNGVERMEAVDGVANVDASLKSGRAFIAGDQPEAATVVALTEHTTQSLGLEFVEGSFDSLTDDTLAVSDTYADSKDIAVGDEASLILADGTPKTFEITAIISTELVNTPFYSSEEVFSSLQLDSVSTGIILIDVADGYDIDTVKQDVIDAVSDMYLFQVFDKDEYVGQIAASIDMVLTMLYALLGLSIVIAALGIVNTLSLSVSDRTREIGLLRAIGLSKAGVRASIFIESIILSLLGAIIGILVGIPLAVGLNTYLADDSTAINVVPWGTLGVILLLAVVVGALASVLPARRAARLDVLDAIATE